MSEESYEIQEAIAERDAASARVHPPRDSGAGSTADAAWSRADAAGMAAVTGEVDEADEAGEAREPGEETERQVVPEQERPVRTGSPGTGGAGGGAGGQPESADVARGADAVEDADVAAESPVGASGVASLELKPALEAVLMVVDEPATAEHLAKVLQRRPREVSDGLRELADDYVRQGRGFELRMVAGGWRYYTRAEYAEAVESFVLDGQQARLTQAALETLAVVAYRQPVSRSRVSAVRGVNCDGVMRTLLQRGLLEEAGTEPETGAILYRTTHYFLERMGLRGLDELPELAPFLPEAEAVEGDSQEGVPSFDVDDSGDLSQTDH